MLLLGFAFLAVSPGLCEEPAAKPPSGSAPVAPTVLAKVPVPEPDPVLPVEGSPVRPAGKPSLLPDEIPPYARRPAAATPPVAKSGTPATPAAAPAPEIDLRIRYRKARNIAESDGKVRAAWDQSRAMRTDDGKRRALKRYQDLLYAKMLSIDRAIAPLVEQRRKEGQYYLEQTKIAPTVPVE